MAITWPSTKAGHQSSWFSVRLSAPLQEVVSTKMLCFSLAESKENSNGKENAIDFTIELKDGSGHRISFPLSQCSYLQPQIAKDISKFRLLDDSPNSEAISDFFYFDITALSRSNPSFLINDIRQIKLLFDKTRSGAIVMDDIFLIGE